MLNVITRTSHIIFNNFLIIYNVITSQSSLILNVVKNITICYGDNIKKIIFSSVFFSSVYLIISL